MLTGRKDTRRRRASEQHPYQFAQEDFSVMGPAVWKGLLRFGLVSIPVKLYRVAHAEKVSFRQLQKTTGARVRHRLCTGSDPVPPSPAAAQLGASNEMVAAKDKANSRTPAVPLAVEAQTPTSGLSREDLTRGYEYEKHRYVCSRRMNWRNYCHPLFTKCTSVSLYSRRRLS